MSLTRSPQCAWPPIGTQRSEAPGLPDRQDVQKWLALDGCRCTVVIRPTGVRGFSHETLERHKRALALAVVRRFTPREIRAQGLANLHRWQQQGTWVTAYDEWRDVLERGDDGELFAAMLGCDERANRLRESPPYVGLLPRDEVAKLNEEAAA